MGQAGMGWEGWERDGRGMGEGWERDGRGIGEGWERDGRGIWDRDVG